MWCPLFCEQLNKRYVSMRVQLGTALYWNTYVFKDMCPANTNHELPRRVGTSLVDWSEQEAFITASSVEILLDLASRGIAHLSVETHKAERLQSWLFP